MRVTPHFKIGVLYCARGQTTEEQMFSNSAGTADYDRFLDLIGDKIVLAGWNRYNGGLDTKYVHSHRTRTPILFLTLILTLTIGVRTQPERIRTSRRSAATTSCST